MKKLKEDFDKMSPYERWKLIGDFLRFLAMMGTPFMIIAFGHLAKTLLGW